MGRIAGVFNNDRAVDQVLKALEAFNVGEDAALWICTERSEVYATGLQELKEHAPLGQAHKHCIACCSCKPFYPRGGLKKRFVADAEIYALGELQAMYHCEEASSSEALADWVEHALLHAATPIDGSYAYAYWSREVPEGDVVHLARDILGVKPLCFVHTDGFAFASEKKALAAMGYSYAIELDPRIQLRYSVADDRLRFVNRRFFADEPTLKEEKEKIKAELLRLLRASLVRRIPRGAKFGVLFSGGLDSSLIVYLCKELDADFCCYTAAVEDAGMKEAEDLVYARSVAADLGVELRIKLVQVEEIESYLTEVVPLIDDTSGVKISVALPLYLACELAKEDGITTVLYGLGTEELFAGYERYKWVNEGDLNRACRAGLLGMHERDLYRDNMIANALGISLRAPFLAPEVVDYALKIPGAYKLSNAANKVILREIALDLGLEKVARRKKRAVQYGSNVIRALERLAKRRGYRYTRDYLRSFYPSRALKLGCLFSSGKDSTFALWLMQQAGYPIECLITIKSRNPESYMFHTPAVELVELQADAMGIPLIMKETEGAKEEELEDLRAALREAKARYGIEGIISGALWSTYQKERIERIARAESLKVFAPLWHMNQETELRLILSTFEVMFTSISAYGLDKSWLGRKITPEDVDRLVELDRRLVRHRDQPGLNVAGEGGEFESLVLDGPLFKKRLVIVEREIIADDAHTARLVVKEARVEDKQV